MTEPMEIPIGGLTRVDGLRKHVLGRGRDAPLERAILENCVAH